MPRSESPATCCERLASRGRRSAMLRGVSAGLRAGAVVARHGGVELSLRPEEHVRAGLAGVGHVEQVLGPRGICGGAYGRKARIADRARWEAVVSAGVVARRALQPRLADRMNPVVVLEPRGRVDAQRRPGVQ